VRRRPGLSRTRGTCSPVIGGRGASQGPPTEVSPVIGGRGAAFRPYLSILGARFRVLLQYRAAAVAGFGTQLFWGLIRMMIFTGFYASTTRAQPMSLPQVITYVWLGQALFAMLPWSLDAEIRAMIRSGAVAYELVRPLDLYSWWYCRCLAARVAPTLLRSLPLFCVAGIFFGLQAPPSWSSGIAWFAATVGSLLVGCAFSNLMNISLLWTITGDGISRLVPTLVFALSGMLLPLPLFPNWAQRILAFIPFRDMVDLPFRLYVGQIPAVDAGSVLAQQIAWTLILMFFGRWLLARGLSRLVVQGG